MSMKDKIRKQYLQIRKNIPNKESKSELIYKKIITTKEYKESKVIALYYNTQNEVSTKKLIQYSLNQNKIVLLPRVEGKYINFYRIKSQDDQLKKSIYGILEPLRKRKNYYKKKKIDLVIVPGVAFTIKGDRLGYGKGYYDRFLDNTNLKTIGICFQEQIIDNLPISDNDIRINKIITDK